MATQAAEKPDVPDQPDPRPTTQRSST